MMPRPRKRVCVDISVAFPIHLFSREIGFLACVFIIGIHLATTSRLEAWKCKVVFNPAAETPVASTPHLI